MYVCMSSVCWLIVLGAGVGVGVRTSRSFD
jgi:hypothetical protein